MRIPQRRSSRASFAQGLVIVSVLAALVALALTAGDSAHAQTAVPAAPTGLTAPTDAHNSVTLSWDDPGDTSITGYRILRRDPVNQAPGVFSTIVSNTGSAATSYTDGTVAAKTRYVYRVKAINAAGLSEQSNYVNAETPAAPVSPSAPAKPTGLAGSVSHDSVALSWNDPEDDSITGYRVLRSSRDGDEYEDGQGAAEFVAVIDDTGSPAASYTDASVTARTRYVYRVKAINSAGLSQRSGYVNVETLAEPATTTVVVVPPEEPEEPEVALQQQVTIIDRGTLTVDPRVPTRGTIGAPGERHRYEVDLQAGRFYEPVHQRGFDRRDPAFRPGRRPGPVRRQGCGQRAARGVVGQISLLPADHRKHIRGGGAGQRRPADGLLHLDGTRPTITASSGNEGRSRSTDFKQFINRAKLHPDDPVSGNLDGNGVRRGAIIDIDYFEANLHAGQTYTFTYSASSVESGGLSRSPIGQCPWARSLRQHQQLQRDFQWGQPGAGHHDNPRPDRSICIRDKRVRSWRQAPLGIHGDAGGAVDLDRTQAGAVPHVYGRRGASRP